MSAPRFCRDCRYYLAGYDSLSDLCTHPKLARRADPVRGEPRSTFCRIAREPSFECGPDALVWEPKEGA